MKTLICIFLLLVCTGSGYSQTFMTRNGYIGFFSKTPLEDIKAENRQVYAVIDAGKKILPLHALSKVSYFPSN